MSEFDWKALRASVEAVAAGLVSAVTSPTQEMRDAVLRRAELRAIVLTGAEIDQAKKRAEACLNRRGESVPVTPLWCPEPMGAPRQLRFDGRRWYAVTSLRILTPMKPF